MNLVAISGLSSAIKSQISSRSALAPDLASSSEAAPARKGDINKMATLSVFFTGNSGLIVQFETAQFTLIGT